MSGQLILVGGGKGGVGKSMVAMATVDYLRAVDADILLIEADRQNQDVALAYQRFDRGEITRHAATLPTDQQSAFVAAMKPMEIEIIDLASRDDWIAFGRLIEQHKHRRIVVNTAVGFTDHLTNHGKLVDDVIRDIGIELVTLWPVNRQRFSLNALLGYASVVNSGRIHVLRNMLFGQPQQFVLLAQAQKVHQLVAGRAGVIADFPDLADLMADQLYSQRLAIESAASDRSQLTVDRIEFARWQAETRDLMGRLL